MRRTFKLNPTLFALLRSGARRFDIRAGSFEVGDAVRYVEHNFASGLPTGRWAEFIVTDVVALRSDCAILSLVLSRAPREADAPESARAVA